MLFIFWLNLFDSIHSWWALRRSDRSKRTSTWSMQSFSFSCIWNYLWQSHIWIFVSDIKISFTHVSNTLVESHTFHIMNSFFISRKIFQFLFSIFLPLLKKLILLSSKILLLFSEIVHPIFYQSPRQLLIFLLLFIIL